MSSAYRSFLTFGAHQKPTVGDTKTSVISNDHMGWLKCDGRSVAVADFEFLFNVIGYSYGGSGDNFNLPNAAGRVPGVTGTGTDANGSTFSIALGSSIGEYQHTLTVGEMPTHNHGVSSSVGNVSTNLELTSLDGTHTHGVTDPGHAHSGTTDGGGSAAESEMVSGTLPLNMNVSGSGSHTHTFTTNISTTGISIVPNGAHRHTLSSMGGSLPHNNVQPTIGMGNMFIYCGRPTYPFLGFPYTSGTLIY